MNVVWLLMDNGYVTEGVYESPEQFTEKTGRQLTEREIEDGKRSYDVKDANNFYDPLYHCILWEWHIGKHDFDYLHPDDSPSQRKRRYKNTYKRR